MRALSVLFLVFTILTIAYASNSKRDYDATNRGQVNNWEYNFALEDTSSSVTTADVNSMAPTVITFYESDNCTCGIGQFRLQCNPDGYTRFNLSIPINFTVEVQQKLRLTDVYIWVGRVGTQPLSGYQQWDDSTVASGGVTFVFHGLSGFIFNGEFNIGDILPVLTNPDGSLNTCYRIEVVIGVDSYCGYSHEPTGIRRSPEGCNFHYESIYPAPDAYFHVALNSEEYVTGVSNDTLFFKGYCLDPTRSIYPNYDYVGEIYSSYDPVVLNSPAGQFVEAPQNFPYVNYIANNEQEYLSRFLSGHQCSWQDVQNAIWVLLFPVATASDPSLLTILNNTSTDCVQWIVSDAYAHGANYTPYCPGGKYLMILFPMINSDCNCTKDLETQLIAFPTGGSCLNRCKPKTCHNVYHKGTKACLGCDCAPLPSPSTSISLSSTASISYSSTASSSYSSTASISQSSTASSSYSSTASISQSSTASSSYSSTASISQSSTASISQSSTASISQSSTASSSYSSTASISQSSTASISQSSTASSSYSSTASISQSSTSSLSYSSTPSVSYSSSFSITSRPILPSTTNSATVSRTPCPSTTATQSPCYPSQSSSHTPARTPCASETRSASHTPCASTTRSASHTPCASTTNTASHTPCASTTRSASHTPCASTTRSASHTPCVSSTRSVSLTSKPILPSASRSPCHPSASASHSPCHPSATPSQSAPCHNMPSASPSRSAPCHDMPSASPSKSDTCQNMVSPSPSPCENMGGGNGRGRGHEKN